MKKIQLPEIEHDPALWISVLADNELSTDDRLELFEYLESNPELWRDCAVALMDSQFLEGHRISSLSIAVGQVSADNDLKSDKAGIRPQKETLPRRIARLSSIAAGMAMMFAAGWWIASLVTSQRYESRLAASSVESAEMISTLVNLRELNRESSPGFMSLADVYDDRPMLVELLDSPERSLYVTDRDIPRSLLDALVAAGHEIELKPWHPRFVPAGMMPVENSLIAVEIKKSLRLNP